MVIDNLDSIPVAAPDELILAYSNSIITEQQLIDSVNSLCEHASVELLEVCLRSSINANLPQYLLIIIQTRIIRERINRYPSNYSIELILDDFNRWVSGQSSINEAAIDIVFSEYVKALPEERQWYLFEKGIITSPTIKVINTHLQEIYRNRDFRNPVLKKKCFQREVVSDILDGRLADEILFPLFSILSDEYIRELRKNGTDKIRFFLWVFDIENDNYFESDIIELGVDWYSLEEEWNQIISFFHLLPNEHQVNLYKYLFYLKTIGVETFTTEELYERLTNHNKNQICKALRLTSFILSKKERALESVITDTDLSSLIYSDNGNPASNLFSLFIKCDGPNVLSYDYYYNKEEYYIVGRVSNYESTKGKFLKIEFLDEISYPCSEDNPRYDPDPVVLDYEYEQINSVKKTLEENIPHIKKGNNTYLISTEYSIRVKEFMMKYHLEDQAQLFIETSSRYLIPLQHHYREDFGKKTRIICEYTGCTRTDTKHGIPFVQCGRSSCVSRNHFIVPIFEWDSYSIVDLLYILCGRDKTRQQTIWNEYKILANSINRVIVRHLLSQQGDPEIIERLNHLLVDYDTPISDLSESEVKVIGNSDNDDEYEWDDMYEDGKIDIDNKNDDDTTTFERYRGTWAQEEEGYSDEEIDSIFDGDPSAYWNID